MRLLRRSSIFVLLALLVVTARAAEAASVTVAWDANSEPDVAGYVVHYGDQSGTYQFHVDVGKTTTLRVDNLAEGKTYYFAVQAYSTGGLTSPMSTEVSASISATTTQPPAPTPQPQTPAQPAAHFLSVPGSDGRIKTGVLRWNTVADAQAYYLYVGSSSGAKDVVDTGEIQATSYTLPGLQPDRAYYARIWTLQQAVWRYTEMVFLVPTLAGPAKLLSPGIGERNVTSAQTFLWNEVPEAQAYYLYVGTQSGAKDVVDTGEIMQTWWTAPALPAGKRLYARVWTKLQGNWYSHEVYFDSASTAVFVYPTSGAADISEREVFTWTGVSEADRYYLYVGTSQGAKDVADTGEIQQLWYSVEGMPPGRLYFARIWSHIGNGWRFSDVAFHTSYSSRLTRPRDASGEDLGPGFEWTSIQGAQAYYLSLGTSPGTKNLIDTGETLNLQYPTPPLPGRQLFARIWTKVGGVWRSREMPFNLRAASLMQPEDGATALGTVQTFTWTTVTNAEAYYLYVGTTITGKDIVDTGEISSTSYVVPGLPPGRTLYVTLWTKIDGSWYPNRTTIVTK